MTTSCELCPKQCPKRVEPVGDLDRCDIYYLCGDGKKDLKAGSFRIPWSSMSEHLDGNIYTEVTTRSNRALAGIGVSPASCKNSTRSSIVYAMPELVILAGAKAVNSALDLSMRTVDHYTGESFPWRFFDPDSGNSHTCMVLITYDVLNFDSRMRKFITRPWRSHLKLASSIRNIPPVSTLPVLQETSEVIMTIDEVKDRMSRFTPTETIALDIETNGLRAYPHREWDPIMMTVSWGNDRGIFSHPVHDPRNPLPHSEITDLLRNFLKDRPVVAHNARFENEWFSYLYGVEDPGIQWEDTMLQNHILTGGGDCGLSLEVLSCMILGYNSKQLTGVVAKECLKIDPHDLLVYNGTDTYSTWEIFKIQREAMGIVI